MKFHATATAFEALAPNVWESIKKEIQNAARNWGVDISIDDDLTVREAIGRFWQANRVYENARLAKPEDA